MNSKDFNELVEARCSKIKATLASKGKEYSTDDDKLHNFNKAGVRSGQSREKALMGMKLKHEISIDDIIINLDKEILPTIEVIDEKIGDIINYFILLEACLVDRIKKENKPAFSEIVNNRIDELYEREQDRKSLSIEDYNKKYYSNDKIEENHYKDLKLSKEQINRMYGTEIETIKVLQSLVGKSFIHNKTNLIYVITGYTDLVNTIVLSRQGVKDVFVNLVDLSDTNIWTEKKVEENPSKSLEGQYFGIDKKAIYRNKDEISNLTYRHSSTEEEFYALECVQTLRTIWIPKTKFFKQFAVWKEDS